jgi:outer membrane lipoprotein carrier protein
MPIKKHRRPEVVFSLWALVCLAGFLPSAISAEPTSPDLDGLLNKIETNESSIRTIGFSFQQNTRLHSTGDTQVISGKAFFMKPNRFRIEHVLPRPQLVVSDGKRVWVYISDRRQVIMDSWKNWERMSGVPKGLLTFQDRMSRMRKRYDVSLKQPAEEGKNVVLIMRPAGKSAWPYVLTLTINPDTGVPMRTELESDTITIVTDVQNPVINPSLEKDFFEFHTPAGVEELRLEESVFPK